MNLGVVIPCYRQERFLPRTLAALEHALKDRSWSGALVLADPGGSGALPELSPHWTVVRAGSDRPLTPGAARNAGLARCAPPWVLFVDADVEVNASWLERALHEAASADAGLAGLWARLEEWFTDGPGERPGAPDLYRIGDAPRECDYLATLALYRTEALRATGAYDARLRSEEDFELGLRLRTAGFRLRSTGGLAGRHWSAPRPSFGEIGRRWRSGLCFGQGQVLRLYLGRAGLGSHLRRQAHYLAMLAVWLAAPLAWAAGGAKGLAFWSLVPLGLLLLMTLRKRSARLAVHSLLTWSVNAAGLVVGFVRGAERVPALPGESPC
ncbi:MAG: glycosyltransferase [Candidatus Eisenbacteria bacterium]|nr:glycosyltransferase [Candidatus Eisenbacteria bacterium]